MKANNLNLLFSEQINKSRQKGTKWCQLFYVTLEPFGDKKYIQIKAFPYKIGSPVEDYLPLLAREYTETLHGMPTFHQS